MSGNNRDYNSQVYQNIIIFFSDTLQKFIGWVDRDHL